MEPTRDAMTGDPTGQRRRTDGRTRRRWSSRGEAGVRRAATAVVLVASISVPLAVLAGPPASPPERPATAGVWSIQSTSTSLAHAALYGIDCLTASFCAAVGTAPVAGAGTAAMSVLWDGTAWTAEAVPMAAGTKTSALDAVSCTAPSACVAVGWATTSTGTPQLLVDAWDGTAWAVRAAPKIVGALNAVSCATANACVAVGRSGRSAVAVKWNGTGWSKLALPGLTNSTYSSLQGVSCTTATDCTAVGNDQVGADPSGQPLALRWQAGVWRVQLPVLATGTEGSLNAVSCASPTACTAVGAALAATDTSPSPLALRSDGTSWVSQAVAGPPSGVGPFLSAVSCGATTCVAVGSYYDASVSAPAGYAEDWDGASWSPAAVPTPAGLGQPTLAGVSCTPDGSCTAVGVTSVPAPGRQLHSAFIDAQ